MNRDELLQWIGARSGFTVTRYPMPGTLEHHLRVLFDRVELDLLIDVGAHAGESGQRARAAGFHGPIVSYDPAPAPALLELAEEDGRWAVRHVACSSVAGEAALHRYGSSHPFNSLQLPSERMQERFEVGARSGDADVQTVRLDQEDLGDATSIFLKIDAQGHDLEVLEGAVGILDRLTLLQMELTAAPIYEAAPLLPEVLARVLDLGFAPTGFFPVSRASDHLRVIEFDGVFLRA